MERLTAALACFCLALAGVAAAGENAVSEDAQTTVEAMAPVRASAAAEKEVFGTSLEPQRVVVTATRIPTPIEDVPNSISVFTAAPTASSHISSQPYTRPTASTAPASSGTGGTVGFAEGAGLLEVRQYRDVVDALRVTPGVSVSSSGGAGTLTDVRVRGMDTGHTVLMFDGMPMNDPSNARRSFSLADFSLDNLGQLEVLRGPQSALYGSSAMGGVVNMTSLKGEGPLSGFFSTEAGSHGTALGRFGASAGNERGDFSIAGSLLHSDGFSVADKANGNREKDAYNRGNINMRLGLNAGDNLRFDLFANAMHAQKQLDGWDMFAGNAADDDPLHDFRQEVDRLMIRPQVTLSLFEGRWEQQAGFGYLLQNTEGKDAPVNAFNRYRYKGETTKFNYQSTFHTHENNSILTGVDVVSESMNQWDVAYGPTRTPKVGSGTMTTVGVFVEDQFKWREVFFLNAGLRYESNDDFGDKVTWKGGAMYVLPSKTRLKASAGTGFSAPTLYQLHIDYRMPGYASLSNSSLKPETTFGWDVGFEQSLLCDDRLRFGSTFFRNKAKNKIEYVMQFDPANPGDYIVRAENINSYRTWGIESFVNFAVTPSLLLSANHTWLRTEEKDTRQNNSYSMSRRPKHEASVNVDWRFHEKGTVSMGVRYMGKRKDGAHRLPSHTVARVAASWKVNDHFEVFGRVENLFNKKYQELYGYGTERLSFYGGASVSF